MSDEISPFSLNIPEQNLQDLYTRLSLTRWPEAESVEGWVQGVPLARAQRLIDYWQHGYDWRRCETMLNSLGQYRTEIDGLGIHFLHIPSKSPKALPLLLTHGWPGSILEFHKVIGLLVDPAAHGGSAEDAFHVIIPSLPDYGFSDKPKQHGWNIDRIAAAWIVLMQRLGYTKYFAQGGDWGSAVTAAIARRKPQGLLGIHLNMVAVKPQPISDPPTLEELDAINAGKTYQKAQSGYSTQQATKPQTLGYALADSPVGQAMWIYEKYQSWTDCGSDPELIFTQDEMLDNIMIYWLANSAASSARLYWESLNSFDQSGVELPVGCTIFPGELIRPPRHWAEAAFPNLIYWNKPERGGHFAAFEQPQIFAEELRNCFRQLR